MIFETSVDFIMVSYVNMICIKLKSFFYCFNELEFRLLMTSSEPKRLMFLSNYNPRHVNVVCALLSICSCGDLNPSALYMG